MKRTKIKQRNQEHRLRTPRKPRKKLSKKRTNLPPTWMSMPGCSPRCAARILAAWSSGGTTSSYLVLQKKRKLTESRGRKEVRGSNKSEVSRLPQSRPRGTRSRQESEWGSRRTRRQRGSSAGALLQLGLARRKGKRVEMNMGDPQPVAALTAEPLIQKLTVREAPTARLGSTRRKEDEFYTALEIGWQDITYSIFFE